MFNKLNSLILLIIFSITKSQTCTGDLCSQNDSNDLETLLSQQQQQQQQFNFCTLNKQNILTNLAENLIKNNTNWKYSNWKYSNVNKKDCHLYDQILPLQSRQLEDKNIFILDQFQTFASSSNFTKNWLENFIQTQSIQREYVEQFMNQTQTNMKQKVFYQSQNLNKFKNFEIVVYNFIASSNPFLTFTQTIKFSDKSGKKFENLEQFKKYLVEKKNFQQEIIEKSFKKIDEIIEVIDLIILEPLMAEKLKFYTNLKLTIGFDSKLEPSLKVAEYFNPFFGESKKQIYGPQELSYIRNIFQIINFISQQYQPEYKLNLTTIIQEFNKKSIVFESDFKCLLDYSRNYSNIPQELINYNFLKQYLNPNKTKVCVVSARKILHQYCHNYLFQTHFCVDKFEMNTQSCDIFLSKERAFDTKKGKLVNTVILDDKQLFCKSPYNPFMTNKAIFYNEFKKFDKLKRYNFDSTSFQAKQYNVNLGIQQEIDDFLELIEQKYDKDFVWIYKNPGGYKGIGLEILKTSQIKGFIEEFIKNNKINKNYKSSTAIFQYYIQNVATLYNKKFDLRNLLLIFFRSDQSVVALYEKGLIRKIISDYDKENLDAVGQLTNFSVQKQSMGNMAEYINDFDLHQNVTANTIEDLQEFQKSHYNLTDEQINEVQHKIKKVMAYTVQTMITQYSEKPRNAYQIFGMDMLLDEQWNPYLIEGNQSPGLGRGAVEWLQMSQRVFQGLGHLVMQFYDQNIQNPEQDQRIDISNTTFEILYDSKYDIDYLKGYKL